MKIFCITAGTLCLLYFLGILFYVGLSSKFPLIWAAGSALFYGTAVLIHRAGTAERLLSVIPAWIKAAVLVLFCFVLVLFLGVEALIVSGMKQTPSANLDYLIVLGAQVNGDKISRSLQMRLEKAEEYLNENPNTKAVLSGGQGAGEDISEAEAMYAFLVSRGISGKRLFMENKSRNTSQNLEYSLRILAKDSSVGIVSNNFHVFRGVSIGKKLGCSRIEGVPSRSDAFLQVNYMLREFFGVVKDKLAGNI